MGQQAGDAAGTGEPGDFGFSDIKKPSWYLHTYRDPSGAGDLKMIEALTKGVGSYLGRLFGSELLPSQRISAGFHYPVRPQYSTLHLQLRVNSGNVCGGADDRGIDLFQLLARLRADPGDLSRDDETLEYQATKNLRTALLAAAAMAGQAHDEEEASRKQLVL